MASTAYDLQTMNLCNSDPIQKRISCPVDELIGSLPDVEDLSAGQRRGIIARYAAVLEGNFIYWMTATLLSVRSEEARLIVLDNLREEVRDCHPGMMRRFALAACAAPTDEDAHVVYPELTQVRSFLGRLSGVPNLVTMAFFEGFIQRFMSYLADLAKRQGSVDMEYTDVHGVCDITHTEELFRAIEAEMAVAPLHAESELFEGVALLQRLIRTIISVGSYKALSLSASHAN